MIKRTIHTLLILLMVNGLSAQEGRFGLSFANEQIAGNTLCVDIELRFRNGGKLGSSNLVMKYNKSMLANPVLSSDNLAADQYHTRSVTNPIDSLATFNIELLTANNGMSIAAAPAKTTVGKICFDVLAGMGANYIDWQIKSTTATVVYLDDESTKLKRGRIEVLCNNVGLTCDDGDANTLNDVYDSNCLCAGTQMNCEDDSDINQTSIPGRTYKSRMKIRSEGTIRPNAKVDFRAGETITLGAGFHAEEGSDFTAMIEACVDNLVQEITEDRNSVPTNKLTITEKTYLDDLSLTVSPNPIANSATVTYILPQTATVRVGIYSMQGQLIQPLFAGTQSEGMHLTEWQVTEMPKGMYFLSLETVSGRVMKKIVVQ